MCTFVAVDHTDDPYVKISLITALQMSVWFSIDSCDFVASIGHNALKHSFVLSIVVATIKILINS